VDRADLAAVASSSDVAVTGVMQCVYADEGRPDHNGENGMQV
jgi:hypothetical protein